MVSSPYLVIYAELLLLVQYVYGMNLNEKELPTEHKTSSGTTIKFKELGLMTWKFPVLHLGAQVGTLQILFRKLQLFHHRWYHSLVKLYS